MGYIVIGCIQTKVRIFLAYQSFTSSKSIGDGIVYCKASHLLDCVEFNDALNLPLTAAAKHAAMALQPQPFYTEQVGLKPIKEVGLYENYGPVIPTQFHAETCPYPSMESWVVVKKLYPIGTMIEKDFDGTKFLGEVTEFDPQARTYTVYYKEDNTTEEMTHYYI